MRVPSMKDVESYKGGNRLQPGWHDVRISACKEDTNGDKPFIQVTFENNAGESLDRRLYVTEKSFGFLKPFLEAVGVNTDEDFDLNPSGLVNRRLRVKVAMEPSYKDPTKLYANVVEYEPAGEGGSAPVDSSDPLAQYAGATAGSAPSEDDIPF